MEGHFLDNEKLFESFLNTLNCKYCSFFKNKKCTHENVGKNEIEKLKTKKAYNDAYVDGWKDTPEPVSEARREMLNWFKESADDIDNNFICDYYE
jgi:hypothetical protein